MKKYSVALVMTAGFCWGLIGIFSKALSAFNLSSGQITFLRCFITALSLGLYLLIFDKEKLKIKLKDIYLFVNTGIFSIVTFNVCYFLTIELVSISVAAILLYTAPCIIMLLSVPLFKEKLTPLKVLCLIMSFTGCVLVTGLGTTSQIPLLGILTGLGSGLGYAFYTIFGRFALKKYHPFTVTFYTFLIASIGTLFFSHPLETLNTVISNPTSAFYAVLLALISTLTPFLCYTKGLNGLEAGTASIIACIEPMVAILADVLFFKMTLKVSNVIGIVLIFAAVIVINFNSQNKKKSITHQIS